MKDKKPLEYMPFWVNPQIHKMAVRKSANKGQTIKGYIEKLVLKDNN